MYCYFGIDGCFGVKFVIFACTGDDFSIIQQEIVILSDCKHSNIVGYLGAYLR